MSKMIQLELTEKEAEIIQELIKANKEHAVQEGIGSTEKKRKLDTCESINKKIDLGYQPTEDVLVTAKDLFYLTDLSNREYQSLSADIYLSKQKVAESGLVKISLVNAVIMWLNTRNLLKKSVVFDITDNSSQYEETE